MYSLLPKHKGTEKMQAEIKRKLSALRRAEGHEHAVKKAAGQLVEKEGAGQVVLLGAPNVGKSRLVASLTNATPLVADYPFTTQRAQPGMMKYKDVQIQLVDLPPITHDVMPTWLPDMVRRADAALLVVDLGGDDVLDDAQVVFDRLAALKIALCGDAVALKAASEAGLVGRRAICVANKAELAGAADRMLILEELMKDRLPVVAVSAAEGKGLDDLRQEIFDLLGVIRVYSKVPGKPADMNDPFVLPVGSTVLDMARTVHKELADQLVRARIWGGGKYDGQSVRRDHVLVDGDVVELHG